MARQCKNKIEVSICYILIKVQDILDTNKFWSDELLKVNKDRLFSVSFPGLETHRNGYEAVRVNGLVGGHAYSVLRAVECRRRRFLVLRNPWGQSEWTGAWGDGSKEWTMEWLQILPELGHQFGDDGQFVMECMFHLQLELITSISLHLVQTRISWNAGIGLRELLYLILAGRCRLSGLVALNRYNIFCRGRLVQPAVSPSMPVLSIKI